MLQETPQELFGHIEIASLYEMILIMFVNSLTAIFPECYYSENIINKVMYITEVELEYSEHPCALSISKSFTMGRYLRTYFICIFWTHIDDIHSTKRVYYDNQNNLKITKENNVKFSTFRNGYVFLSIAKIRQQLLKSITCYETSKKLNWYFSAHV